MKLSTFFALLLFCLLALAALIGYGHYRVEKKIEPGRRDLVNAAAGSKADLGQPAGLPEPVARYFSYAVGNAKTRPAATETTTAGSFLIPLLEKEFPISSRQVTLAGETAFVYDARVDLMPGVWLRFFDIYGPNRFESKKYLDSLVDVKPSTVNDGLEKHLLGLWLLTAPLNPVSLLANKRVSWEKIDELSALATVSSPLVAKASALVFFNRDGGIERLELQRPLETLPYLPAMKSLTVDSYAMQNGIMAPTRFFLSGTGDGGETVIWRGRSGVNAIK